MDALIKELRQKPGLKFLANELNEILREEDMRREEFYNTITEDDKAEFINGEIIMHSPVKRRYGKPTVYLVSLLHAYSLRHDPGEIYTEKAMIHLTRNSYEPDIVYFKKDKAKLFTDDQMIFPAPDLIVEILSPTTEKYDRGIKFTDYSLHGIKEYWIIDPVEYCVEQYLLKQDTYHLEYKGKTGSITSEVLAGFTIEIKAVFNEQESLKALQQILLP